MFTDAHMQYQLNKLGTRLRNGLMAAIYRYVDSYPRIGPLPGAHPLC